jgi:hypothetical protein
MPACVAYRSILLNHCPDSVLYISPAPTLAPRITTVVIFVAFATSFRECHVQFATGKPTTLKQVPNKTMS